MQKATGDGGQAPLSRIRTNWYDHSLWSVSGYSQQVPACSQGQLPIRRPARTLSRFCFAYTGFPFLKRTVGARDSVTIGPVRLSDVQTPFMKSFLDGTKCLRVTYRLDRVKLDCNYSSPPPKRPKLIEVYLSPSDYHFLFSRLISLDKNLPQRRTLKVVPSGEEHMADLGENYTGLARGLPAVSLWEALYTCRGTHPAAGEIEITYSYF